jgi:ankyrin repeat protein
METLNEDLCKFVKTPYVECTKILLEKGADINYKDKRGLTPLKQAINSNQLQQLTFLINKGADLMDLDDFYTFSYGVDNNITQIMDLIKNKEYLNKNGSKLLYYACMNKRFDVMKLLLDANVDPNISYDNKIALISASKNNFDDVVECLLANEKTNIDIVDQEGNTALLSACGDEKNLNVIKKLLELGANPNIQNENGLTALITTIIYCHKKIVDILLQIPSLNINLKDKHRNTALIHAVYYKEYTIAEKLIKHGADHTIKDNSGKTAMDFDKCDKLKKIIEEYEASKTIELIDSKGKKYPQLIEIKPKHISEAICYGKQERTKILNMKGTKQTCYVWNEKEKTWEFNSFDAPEDYEIEIANDKMHYHTHPFIENCFIRYECLKMEDGPSKAMKVLYQ